MPITADGHQHVTYGPIQGFAKNGKVGQLPTRQVICLMGVAQGKNSKEIAQDQGIQPSTVNRTLIRAYHSLSDYSKGFVVRNAAQAVYEAMKRGIIAPLLILLALAGPMITGDELRRPNPPRMPRPVARVQARGRRREI
ncbi:hypothetical protein SAMN05660443_0216 [Marinospirillum celere]|uniref:Regulatory protein, luxR family n=1 Tax=Marinospirillum celere TaxID=1122252 RepID=A0A1I1DZ45_9GAMM|nr:hypothetical protein [Marinospirillum celere]SFB80181.1 hypothetical protein SAMN05660443_0216 [Marinospirillum celere]